jgi:fatty-acyl-CoA synthase
MLSYSRGPDAPLIESSIWQVFEQTARRFPDRDALVSRHQGSRLTFAGLAAAAERTARGLAGLGIGAQDRVGVWSTNCVEWVHLHLACARLGAVLVNINPANRGYELAYVLRKCGMKALFLQEKDKRSDYRAILEEAKAGQRLALEHVVYLGSDGWVKMLEQGRDIAAAPTKPDEVTNIQYTSGTTGSPKGVLLTHRNVLNNAAVIAEGLRIDEGDRIVVPVPLYHCFGCVIGTLVCVVTGAAMILPSATFDALETLQAIEEERATTIYGVPTMFIAELEHPEFRKFDLRSLGKGMMAGAPCPVEIMRRVAGDMHCAGMVVGYGQTESSPVITMSAVDDCLERRVSTVGQVCPNTEIKIVSANGETVGAGERGELCTRGYLVMKGYDQEPEATRCAVDEDGWLHTGDMATMDHDECIRITGRARDMIIRGGENVYPREVEEFLHTHPKIAEVQVVGIPDRRLGETVVAWIRLKEPAAEEEIRDFCRGKIAHFKVPQYIRFVQSFPMTASGKVQKFRIREVEIRDRGLEAVAHIQMA